MLRAVKELWNLWITGFRWNSARRGTRIIPGRGRGFHAAARVSTLGFPGACEEFGDRGMRLGVSTQDSKFCFLHSTGFLKRVPSGTNVWIDLGRAFHFSALIYYYCWFKTTFLFLRNSRGPFGILKKPGARFPTRDHVFRRYN